MKIDLNADLGEGAGFDAALMPLITSANVCCGKHAGGPDEIRDTLALANSHGVAVGAHPGYNDREHFGRLEMHLGSNELRELLRSQIAAIPDARYVKAHGALYNQACRDDAVAGSIAEVAAKRGLPVVGLPGSRLAAAAARFGAPFVAEGFADRRYREDGSLVPRNEPEAFVHDPAEAVRQVERLIRDRGIRTVCIHGDNPQAIEFAAAVRQALLDAGFHLCPFA
ncbi:MAG: 5-oxoprolinase subunit PxpA [Gemmataceae bacterium]